jgi:predicted transposase YdaD
MPGPHDQLVRFTFEHPERAAAELRAVLPPQVVAQIDWSSLRRESGSVVDEELRESQSDLLFSARLQGGEPLLLYLLLEHQSTVDRWMALRMLQYVLRQLMHWRQKHPKSEVLPVIIPVVMFHGAPGGWTAARQLESLFPLPEGEATEWWRGVVPHFEYLVDDLTREREDALRARWGPPLVKLVLLLLRGGRSKELSQRLLAWKGLFAEVYATPEGPKELRAVVHYLLEVGGPTASQDVRRVLDSVAGENQTEAWMKTMGQILREEGRAIGLEEGLLKGRAMERAEGVLRLLEVRGVTVTAKARQRVLACTDLDTLERWFRRAATATRLSEIW